MLTTISRSHCRRTLQLSRKFAAIRSLSTEHTPSDAPHPHHPPPVKSTGPGPSRQSTSRPLFHPSPRSSTVTSARQPPPFLPYLSPTFGRNQMLKVPDATRALLERIVGQFHAPIRYAFAYGSGVFEQAGYNNSNSRPMLDFVFAVTHPDHWHSINMHQHPHHYPLHARVLGSNFVSKVENISPGIWFNAFVEMEDVVRTFAVYVTWFRSPRIPRMHQTRLSSMA
jgi:mitochondrial translocator assembly and maintenance protein 41